MSCEYESTLVVEKAAVDDPDQARSAGVGVGVGVAFGDVAGTGSVEVDALVDVVEESMLVAVVPDEEDEVDELVLDSLVELPAVDVLTLVD